MSRTIRTPKVYRSRKEFLKAVSRWARNLDFVTTKPNTAEFYNLNPFLATITVKPNETARSTMTTAYLRGRAK